MEDIYYNTETKEVTVITGYGIGSHLSLDYLKKLLLDFNKLFPKLTNKQISQLKFYEVSRNSRRHRSMWYTTFKYKLPVAHKETENETAERYFKLDSKNDVYIVYPVHSLEDNKSITENCASIIARLVHD